MFDGRQTSFCRTSTTTMFTWPSVSLKYAGYLFSLTGTSTVSTSAPKNSGKYRYASKMNNAETFLMFVAPVSGHRVKDILLRICRVEIGLLRIDPSKHQDLLLLVICILALVITTLTASEIVRRSTYILAIPSSTQHGKHPRHSVRHP